MVPLDGHVRLLSAGDVVLPHTPWGQLVARCCPGTPVPFESIAAGAQHIGWIPGADLPKLRESMDDLGSAKWHRLSSLDRKHLGKRIGAEEALEVISL